MRDRERRELERAAGARTRPRSPARPRGRRASTPLSQQLPAPSSTTVPAGSIPAPVERVLELPQQLLALASTPTTSRSGSSKTLVLVAEAQLVEVGELGQPPGLAQRAPAAGHRRRALGRDGGTLSSPGRAAGSPARPRAPRESSESATRARVLVGRVDEHRRARVAAPHRRRAGTAQDALAVGLELEQLEHLLRAARGSESTSTVTP